MNERIKALGEYEKLKKDLTELGIRAGSHLATAKEELGFGRDFLEIDFRKVKTLVAELAEMSREAKEISAKLERLKTTFSFE